MAKLKKASDDVIEFVENIIYNKTNLEHYINWHILSIDKQKELIKITKASPTVEYLAKTTDSVVIYINEALFDRLEPSNTNAPDIRELLILDALTCIDCVQPDNGDMKILISKPQINITSAGYAKYGDTLVKASETMVLAYEQMLEEAKEKKDREKAEKAAKRAAKNKEN